MVRKSSEFSCANAEIKSKIGHQEAPFRNAEIQTPVFLFKQTGHFLEQEPNDVPRPPH